MGVKGAFHRCKHLINAQQFHALHVLLPATIAEIKVTWMAGYILSQGPMPQLT